MTIDMTSRQRILDHFRAHPGSTPGEIARALRQTPANARHHLRVLDREGLVQSTQRRTKARGRPEKAYSPSRASQGDNLAALSSALLDRWLAALPASDLEGALRELADQLFGGQIPKPGTPLARRLSVLVEQLAGLHYQPRWEARPSGPQVTLGHCPFGAIIARHPELCRLDSFLLEQSLGRPARQVTKLQPNERGLPVCVFTLS